MRVTEKQRFVLSQLRIGKQRVRQIKLTEQLSSGIRVNRPSDDSIAAKKVSVLQTEYSRIEQYQKNVEAAHRLLTVADHTVGESSNTLFRLKEIAIRGLNSSMTPSDRNNLAEEIATLRDHMMTLANTRTENRYIFGGYAMSTPPYDNAFNFVGDTNTTSIAVGDSSLVKATIPGGSAFGDGTAATVDVFDNINQLETAVRLGIEVDMQNELERLEESIEQGIEARRFIGLQLSRVEASKTILAYKDTELRAGMAQLKDVDFTSAVSQLKVVENALQATIATSSRLMKGTSLLDYL